MKDCAGWVSCPSTGANSGRPSRITFRLRWKPLPSCSGMGLGPMSAYRPLRAAMVPTRLRKVTQ